MSVASCTASCVKSVVAVGPAVTVATSRRRRMSKCTEKLSPSTRQIASSVTVPYISTVAWIQLPRLRSGLATLLTVRISEAHIQTMVELNQSCKGASPGAGAVADATIHFLHRDDREPTWAQPAIGLAV